MVGKETFRTRLGRLFWKARKDRGMTQETVAIRAGMTESALSYIERGRNSPSAYSAIRLAQVLRIDLEEIMKLLGKPR